MLYSSYKYPEYNCAFEKNMRILITDITGFIGIHLFNHLFKNEKYEIIGMIQKN